MVFIINAYINLTFIIFDNECIKVQLKEIEKTRISLFNNGILNNNYKILKEDDFAYIPVKSKLRF